MLLDTVYAVETPEGIAIALRPAGPVARMLAYALDLLIRIGIFIAISMALGAWGGFGMAVLLISYFLLEWIYPVAFELSRWGATPGKRAMGLKVVMDSGLPITPAASLVRNLLRGADFLPFMFGGALVCMLYRKDFKRMGDLAAGSLVVHTKTVVLHTQPLTVPALAPIRPLNLAQQTAIVAWAARSGTLTPERLNELAELVQGVAPAPEPESPRTTASHRLLGVARWLMGHRTDKVGA